MKKKKKKKNINNNDNNKKPKLFKHQPRGLAAYPLSQESFVPPVSIIPPTRDLTA